MDTVSPALKIEEGNGTATATATSLRTSRPASPLFTALAGVMLLLAWGGFFWQIRSHWEVDSHYFYGWFVPAAMIYLIYRRWEVRPTVVSQPLSGWGLALLIFPVLAFARLLYQATPSWRPLAWAYGFALVAFTFAVVYGWGGRRWAWHFAFPIVFGLSCVPWLGSIEFPLIARLTGIIASTVSTLLQLLGLPAELQGANINIRDFHIEVGQACSGIRSLQIMLVAALFLGEVGLFTARRRIMLLVLGFFLAVLLNALRALALALVAVNSGFEAYASWHDSTGLFASFAGLALLIFAFTRLESSQVEIPINPGREKRAARSILATAAVALSLLAVAGLEIGSRLWYKPVPAAAPVEYSLNWEELSRHLGYYSKDSDPRTYDLLKCAKATDAGYLDERRKVSLTLIEWPPETGLGVLTVHNPEICMGFYGGLTILGKTSESIPFLDGQLLHFETYRFKVAGKGEQMLVYSMHLGDTSHNAQEAANFGPGRGSKLRRAFTGLQSGFTESKRYATQLLLIALTAPPSAEEAGSWIESFVKQSVARADTGAKGVNPGPVAGIGPQ